jgi:hypothetical protein
MADAFAERLKREAPDDVSKQIERAFELAFGRPCTAEERAASQSLVKKHGLTPLCRVLLNTNGFLYVR